MLFFKVFSLFIPKKEIQLMQSAQSSPHFKEKYVNASYERFDASPLSTQ